MPQATFYSQAPDGQVKNDGPVYATVHKAITGTLIDDSSDGLYIGNRLSVATYHIYRGFLYFDTSPLDALGNIRITLATVSLYGNIQAEPDAGHSDIRLYEGAQADALTTADYEAWRQAPKTIGASAEPSAWAVNYSWQRKLFYMAGLLWAFYADGTNNLVYRTSPDKGATWSAATIWKTYVASPPDGHSFAMYFDGTYLHYAFTGADASAELYYRRATPEIDGTLTWSAAEQLAYTTAANWNCMNIEIIVDDEGYPWISYCLKKTDYPITGTDAVVTKSDANDGTWSTEAGFPHTFVSGATTALQFPHGMALTGGKTFWMYTKAASGTDYQYGKLWTGSWGGEEECTLRYGGCSTITTVGDGDDIHIVYVGTPVGEYDYGKFHRKRTYGVGWGEEFKVCHWGYDCPIITLTGSNSIVALWQGQDEGGITGHLLYRKMVNGVWEDAVDWIDESVDTIPMYASIQTMLTSVAALPFAVLYAAKAASPFDVRVANIDDPVGADALLSDDFSAWDFPLACDDYDTITLNTQGLSVINKTGTTKFCLRCTGDVNVAVPTDFNYSLIWSNEKGLGFQPRLIVNYDLIETIGSGAGGVTGAAQRLLVG